MASPLIGHMNETIFECPREDLGWNSEVGPHFRIQCWNPVDSASKTRYAVAGSIEKYMRIYKNPASTKTQWESFARVASEGEKCVQGDNGILLWGQVKHPQESR